MAIIQEMENEELVRKPAIISLECEEMLNEALAYIAQNSLKQAQIMCEQFYNTLNSIEGMPGIGTIYKDGIRKIKIGKFRYNMYYREEKDYISIRGIWHTSRGTEFTEPVREV
jgi:plasmid stabilization system protein ParE